MNESVQIIEGIQKTINAYGISVSILLVLLGIVIYFLFQYQTNRIEALAKEGVEQALKNYQKSLDVHFSEDAVKNALKIEVGKKSIEKKLATWEALFFLLRSNAATLENARKEGELGQLSLQDTDPPFRDFNTFISENEIYLGRELAEKFINASDKLETRIPAYVRCFGNLTPQGFPREDNQAVLADQINQVKEAIEMVQSWLQENLYTINNIADYEKSVAAKLELLNGPKPNDKIS